MPILPTKSELPLLVREPARFARIYWIPLLILLIGATADAITTFQNAVQFGASIEMHIVQRWVQELFGVYLGVPLAKLGQLTFVVFVAAWWRPWTPWLLCLCGLLYSAAAMSNHYQWL